MSDVEVVELGNVSIKKPTTWVDKLTAVLLLLLMFLAAPFLWLIAIVLFAAVTAIMTILIMILMLVLIFVVPFLRNKE